MIGLQTDEFPAFYTRTSGLPIPEKVDSVSTASEIMQTKWELGKEVTPFLLSKIEKTGGKSLDANIALVKNNARKAAELACEYNYLEQ